MLQKAPFLEMAVDQSFDGIAIFDTQDVVLYANAAWAKMQSTSRSTRSSVKRKLSFIQKNKLKRFQDIKRSVFVMAISNMK